MPDNFTPDGSSAFDEFLARYLDGERARAAREIDLSRFLSARTQEILQNAGRFALQRGQRELDALHVLRVVADEPTVSEAVRRIGIDPRVIAQHAEERLPAPGGAAPVDGAVVTRSVQRLLFHSFQVARSAGSTYIDPEHMFFALVLAADTPAGTVLSRAGVTAEALTEHAGEAAGQQATTAAEQATPEGATSHVAHDATSTASLTPMLDRFGTDLTARAAEGKIDPVIGRAAEIEQTIEILSRRTKNNPVLVGEAGVGKTAIVEGLARAIAMHDAPAGLRGKRIVSLDLAAMLSGARYRGDFEERLTATIDEVVAQDGDVIVFLDEIHTVVGAGNGDGALDAANILKPRLARGELRLVGATTLREYRTIEKDPALERRFQPVRIEEPSAEEAVAIVAGVASAFAEHHGVQYTDSAVRAAVELTDRYLADRVLPDKAIDVLDQAGARESVRRSVEEKQIDHDAITAKMRAHESAKAAAIIAEEYEEASRLRDDIMALQRELTEASQRSATAVGGEINDTHIAGVISRATGIPVAKLTATDRQRLSTLEEELHERVIGQDDAVAAVSRAVRRNRAGMSDAGRPVGSFLFLGPTGVGKTELAKSLAHSLFDDETQVIRFDMSEFGERHTVSRLVGAPPGYVGYDEAGQLTERVRQRPYSVVLFDEIEKAHPDVFNVLLQVLDDGHLTDGQGRRVDFSNTVVVMTSNIGSEFLASRGGAMGFVAGSGGSTGFGTEKDLRDRVNAKLREAMRPEFLNRIDEIVLFRKLEAQQLHTIVRMLIEKTAARLAVQGMSLEVSDAAVNLLAERGYEPEYGARPLRRLVQRELDDRISDLLLSEAMHRGTVVSADVAEGQIVLGVRAMAQAA